jgi:hypothetical protein
MFPHFCLLVPKLQAFTFRLRVLHFLFDLLPPPSAMVPELPNSHFHDKRDFRVLRKVIGWQSPGYDERMQRGFVSLTGMSPGDFVYFLAYALARLVLVFSSFFFMLLEHYGLQLQYLSPHSITQVTVFIHLCKMFVGVWPSVRLIRRFHVLHLVCKQLPRISGYYFQQRTKGPSRYIATLTPSRWDHWSEVWVLMQIEAHERLVLPTAAPTAPHADWSRTPICSQTTTLCWQGSASWPTKG